MKYVTSKPNAAALALRRFGKHSAQYVQAMRKYETALGKHLSTTL